MAAGWRIEDTGGRPELLGPGIRYVLPYSRDFLSALSRYRRGDELIDELLRSEHPPYILERLRALLRGHDVRRCQVLDFGCGAGASAVSLARLGIPRIVGIDVVNDYAAIWRDRLAEAGFPGVGHFVQAGDTMSLPFRDAHFDAVFLNGLVEHLLPEERTRVLGECWRVLRSGGHLFLTETPNRWFPRNSHTKLWFSELLPLPLAARLAARLGPRRDFPTRDRVAIYRTGIRGASEGQLRRALGSSARQLRVPDEIVAMEFLLPRNPLQSAAGEHRGGRITWRFVRMLGSLPGLGPHVLSPHLNLVFRKGERRVE